MCFFGSYLGMPVVVNDVMNDNIHRICSNPHNIYLKSFLKALAFTGLGDFIIHYEYPSGTEPDQFPRSFADVIKKIYIYTDDSVDHIDIDRILRTIETSYLATFAGMKQQNVDEDIFYQACDLLGKCGKQ